jgi:hypothetical protein
MRCEPVQDDLEHSGGSLLDVRARRDSPEKCDDPQHSLGDAATKVSTRQLPDFLVRFMAKFVDPSLRAITPALGRRARHTTAKAESVLGWTRRQASTTVVDCGRSLIEWKVA